MTHRLGLLALAVSFLAVGGAFADSPGTRLTKENIGEQPLRIIVGTEELANDSIRFTVSVQRKQAKAPPGLSAWLSVFDREAQVINCQIAGGNREGAAVYEFIVARKYLGKSKLLLEETDARQRGLPQGEVYWFYLQDLMPAAADGKGPQKKPAP